MADLDLTPLARITPAYNNRPVSSLAAVPMPDGVTLLASAGRADLIEVWDPISGASVYRLAVERVRRVRAMVAIPLPDGPVIAAGGDDGTIELFDPRTGIRTGSPRTGHKGSVTALLSFSLPDGRVLLASMGVDETVRLWDPVAAGSTDTPLIDHINVDVPFVAFPWPDGRPLLACASRDGFVRLWDPANGVPIDREVHYGTGPITALASLPMPDRRTVLAVAVSDTVDGSSISLWDPESGSTSYALRTKGQVERLATFRLPDGRSLLAASTDRSIRLWDPTSPGFDRSPGEPIAWSAGMVAALAAVPLRDGRTLLAAGGENTIQVWGPVSADPAPDLVERTLTGHIAPIFSLATLTTPDGRTELVSGSGDRTIRRWDPATERPIGEPISRPGIVRALVTVPLSNGRTLLASAGNGSILRLWSTDYSLVREIDTGQSGPILALAAARVPDGRTLLVSAGSDATVRVWNAATGNPVRPPTSKGADGPFAGHAGAIRALTTVTMPNGTVVLVSAGDKAIFRWDPATGLPIGQPLIGHTDAVLALAPVPTSDGRTLLASAGEDSTVRLWDPVTGEPVGEPLLGHTGGVAALTAVRFPENRTLLASAGHDTTVRLWDPATGEPVGRPLTGHTSGVLALVAIPLPDGDTLLASAGEDTTIRLWTSPETAEYTPPPPSTGSEPPAPPDARTEAPGVRDDTATQDILGREILAGHLGGLLEQLTAGGSSADDSRGTAVIHIDGRWGSGKSTLVTLLRRRLSGDSPGAGTLVDPIFVPYDAWRESTVAPEWWSLATALNRAVRGSRAGAARAAMTVLGTALRVARSRPALLSIGVLLAFVVTQLAGVWQEASKVSGWLTAVSAVAAIGLAAGRVLFWTSPAFGKLYLKSDDNPLGEVAAIVGRLRRWSPRTGHPHRAADTALALCLILAALVVVRSAGAYEDSTIFRAVSQLGQHWVPAVLVVIVAGTVVTGWRRRVADHQDELEVVAPTPVRTWSLAARVAGLVAAGAAAWLLWTTPLPTAAWWQPDVVVLALLVVTGAGYTWLVARTRKQPRKPIILVIDDLDRCTVDRAVKLLETVHTLLRQRAEPQFFRRWRSPAPLVVLVVADGRWVRTAFESIYEPFTALGSPVHGLGADFLQKLFDHTVLVPALAADQVSTLLDKVTDARPAPAEVAPAEPVPDQSPAEEARADALRAVAAGDPSDLRSPDLNAKLSNVNLSSTAVIEVETRRVEREATSAATEHRSAHLLTRYAALMPTNPRLVKRVANAWGMLCAVQSHLHPGRSAEVPPHDHVVRAAIMFVRFPSLVDELLSCPHPPLTGPGSAPESPWLRADVQQLLTDEDGDEIPPALLARCFGRVFPPARPRRETGDAAAEEDTGVVQLNHQGAETG